MSTPPLCSDDFLPRGAADPAASSTEDRLAYLSPTLLRLRMTRYHAAVFAFDSDSPERAAIRKRWSRVEDLAADNPLTDTDAFLNPEAAGRVLAQLATEADAGDDHSDATVSIPTGSMT